MLLNILPCRKQPFTTVVWSQVSAVQRLKNAALKLGFASCGLWAKFNLVHIFVATETEWLTEPNYLTFGPYRKKKKKIADSVLEEYNDNS